MNFIIGSVLIISLLLKIVQFIYHNVLFTKLNTYGYTEFLINFQGGFVRRGFLGEILYQIYKFHPYPLETTIFIFSCIIFAIVCIFFFCQFKKQNICWWLLLSPLFLNFITYIVRKDYMLYAILIVIVYLLRSSSRDILKKSIACLLVILSFLIHEAFLFWGFVLYAILMITDKRHKALNYSLIAIPVVAVAIISYFKGSAETAHTIVDSWNVILPNQPLAHIHHNSIGAIGWDTLHTMLYHLKLNLSPSTLGGGIVLLPLFLGASYYLFSNYMFFYSNGDIEERNAKRMEISLLYPVFCISLIPMLTILSCDTGRVFQYATISTFCAFLILPQQRVFGIFPQWYKAIVRKFNNWLDEQFPPTKTSVTFLLLILAVSTCFFNLNTSWTESVIGSIISNCASICLKLSKFFM